MPPLQSQGVEFDFYASFTADDAPLRPEDLQALSGQQDGGPDAEDGFDAASAQADSLGTGRGVMGAACLSYLSDLDTSGSEQDPIRLHGFAHRVIRLKTVRTAGDLRSAKTVFDVAIEFDDNVQTAALIVAPELAEKFLDISASDYDLLMSMLTDKAEKKAAQKEYKNRFQHFQGLFWVQSAPGAGKENELDRPNGYGESASARGKGSKSRADAPNEKFVLVDFAMENVALLCSNMLKRHG